MSSSINMQRTSGMLGAQAGALEALCRSLPKELYRWSPPNGAWSIHVILCHLLDEERDDFRCRLKSMFDNPAHQWPRIDPEKWVESRNYAQRDTATVLSDFQAERRASRLWLEHQDTANWDSVYPHGQFGPIRARDLLAAWLDHDRLHLRQILRVLHQASEALVPDAMTDYAGLW